MNSIIEATKNKAYGYLRAFGFDEEEIEPVIQKGLRDLENTLVKLQVTVRSENTPDLQTLDDLLHGLKGLLFQLGNHELAKEVDAIRRYENPEELCMSVEKTLFTSS